MKILITDANILIDLLKTGTEGHFFNLEYEIYTTLAAIIECDDKQQAVLNKYRKAGKLLLYNFEPEDDGKIENLIYENKGLSPADCSVLYITGKLDATLLTGDKKLRKIAEDKKFKARGIFWVFDEMLNNKVIDKTNYKRKLTELRKINRWLPVEEFGKRL